MSDVLFGQSYFLRFDPKLWQAMQPFPPLGTLYAAALARRHGYHVALFDAMLAESEAEWEQALERRKPRWAVLFEDNFNYLSKMCLLRMRQAALAMIAAARRQGCTVIAAGADASDHPDLYLDAGADYVLLGEGEQTLIELLDSLSGRSAAPPAAIPGLAWRQDGQVQSSGRRPELRDLDALPFPAWDLVDIPRYRRAWMERHGYFAMNIAATRGCPYHCNWCAKPIWGQRYNLRSPENVAAEIAWLKQTYHPDRLWFVDDIFGLKPGWAAHLADCLEAGGVRIPFKCLSRADLLLRAGEVGALRRAGASIVWLGAESGSQQVLDAMEKGIRVEQIHAAADALHAAGIQVGFFLQFGYPGETRADIEQTIRMVRACRPDDIGVSVSYPLPGTKFHAAVQRRLGARQNWYDSDDLAMLYRGPFTTRFYRRLHRRLHTEFRRDQARRALSGGRAARRGRALLVWAYYALRLPFERLRLRRLENLPHRPLEALPVELSTDEAAIPSPQD